ncbi:MAG: phosphate/phosphite/phosphonate ABC transporter substrate-binding protein, partial [Planctomycetes bacterium]|nr:phosphate/phosphite/phosphonate ABC transporter substrate-binding protein [Planctomycetota bacterium]
MMKANTGLDGTVSIPENAMLLAEQMNEGKVHVGVFQGHEFAWARSKYPDLIPIMTTIPLQPVQSYCLVKWDCKAKTMADLKGEKISLPPVHRDYSELFLAKQKGLHMNGGTFSGQISAALATEAIQNVIDDKVACTVVDSATFHFFESVYPGQFQNLKILCQSEVFPNACIAIKKGELDEKTIEKFRKALLNAGSDPTGRPMLVTWKLKGFGEVPSDYEAQLKVIEKAYPKPPALRTSVDK